MQIAKANVAKLSRYDGINEEAQWSRTRPLICSEGV